MSILGFGATNEIVDVRIDTMEKSGWSYSLLVQFDS